MIGVSLTETQTETEKNFKAETIQKLKRFPKNYTETETEKTQKTEIKKFFHIFKDFNTRCVINICKCQYLFLFSNLILLTNFIFVMVSFW